LTLGKLIEDYVMTTGHSQFVIYDEDKLHGILNLNEMKAVPRKKWKTTTVDRVMTPTSRQTTAYIDQPASEVLDRMNVYRIKRIPVLDGNRVAGLAVREAILRFDKTLSKLRM
jgi:CBS domain-containing protein